MVQDDSTKDDLIKEITELTWRLRSLEAELAGREIGESYPKPADRRSSGRVKLPERAQLIADFDLLEADELDIAKGGLSFKLFEPLRIHLRHVRGEGAKDDYCGHVVWAGRDPLGQLRLAIEFSETDLPADSF